MKNNKFTFIITSLIFFSSSLLFSQTNDTPLSFDEDIPFSLVSGSIFRGSEFFYEKTYQDIKDIRNCLLYLQAEGFINSNSNLNPIYLLSKKFGSGLDLTPTAYNLNFNLKDTKGSLFFQVSQHIRSYTYFSYRDNKGDTSSQNDFHFIGEIKSGITSLALGIKNDYFTPVILWNFLYSEHEDKEDELSKIPEEYREIYTDRFNEVESRLDSIGFKKEDKDNFSFIGYSKEFGVGCILAPQYTKIDLKFLSGINSNNSILPFSQSSINVCRVADLFFHTRLTSFIDYSIKFNFKDPKFNNYKNTVSDLKFDLGGGLESNNHNSYNKALFNLIARLQYDHSINELASFKIGITLLGFEIIYEHNNSKLFIPDTDRLYSNSITFSFGGCFLK